MVIGEGWVLEMFSLVVVETFHVVMVVVMMVMVRVCIWSLLTRLLLPG